MIEVFTEEKPRLLPLPVNAFECDLIKPVRSGKTIYVRYDGNDYSIPPEAVGRQLMLVADPEAVRLLDGEQEIARLVAAGQMSKEIAAKLNLSVRTVEKHRANIMEKVGVREVASLTRWCIQAGLVDT